MIFGDGDGSEKNNGTYFEISFRNIAIEMYPSKITEKHKIKPRKSRYSLNTRLVWKRKTFVTLDYIPTSFFTCVSCGKAEFMLVPGKHEFPSF